MSDNNIKLNERVSVTGNQYVEILQAEIAKLREELAVAIEEVNKLCDSIEHCANDREGWKQRAEAAEEQLAVIERAHKLMTKTCMQWRERAEAAEAAHEASLKILEKMKERKSQFDAMKERIAELEVKP